MTFEDELGPLLRQAGSAYKLPTPAGAEQVTARYQRRHRRRTSIAGIAAALVLAVASYGVVQATAVDESSTVATVPEPTIAVVDENAEPAARVAEVAETPQPISPSEFDLSSDDLAAAIGSIVSVGDRYVGVSYVADRTADGVVGPNPRILTVESVDGQEWAPRSSGELPQGLGYVRSIIEGDDNFLLLGGQSGLVSSGGAMYLSDDMDTWTEIDVPSPEPAEGLVTVVSIQDVAHGPAGYVASVDVYEEIDPERFGFDEGDVCSITGAKGREDATEATYTLFPCTPGGEYETAVFEVDATFQPRSVIGRAPSLQLLLIGDGSAPELIDAPDYLSTMTADESGYTAIIADPETPTVARSVDGRTWTTDPAALGDVEVLTGPSHLAGGFVSIGDRLLLADWGPDSTKLVASDDFGASWKEVAMPYVEGVGLLQVGELSASEYGVAITATSGQDPQVFAPGAIAFEFETDDYVFRSAATDLETMEIIDPSGVLVGTASVVDVVGFNGQYVEIDGMVRDAAGRLTVLDDAGEELVSFHPQQVLTGFESIGPDPASGSVTIEKEGYVLDMVLEGFAMTFTLSEGSDEIGSWRVDEDVEGEPGLTFDENEDAVFTDPLTGEELLVITEAEGRAAFEAAEESGVDFGGPGSQTTYIVTSRDGVNWEVAGNVEAFGATVVVGDGEVLVSAFGPLGNEITILPMPGG